MEQTAIAFLAFTARGRALADRLAEKLGGSVDCAHGPGSVSLSGWTSAMFPKRDALVFVGAAGIAVRAVAPHLQGKTADPAVVVLDETGRFVISLLSGHLGGANDLARRIAELCGGTAVITTATDLNGVFAVDLWAKRQGMTIRNPAGIKHISARLLAGETVSVASAFSVFGTLPKGVVLRESAREGNEMKSTGKTVNGPEVPDVIVDVHRWYGGRENASLPPSDLPLVLVPGALVLGIGCRRGVSEKTIEAVWQTVCQREGVWPEAVFAVASVCQKAREPGLLAFCQNHGWPLETFSPNVLSALDGTFSASPFVEQTVGVSNVCERSAVCLSGGPLVMRKYAKDGVTMALALKTPRLDWSME